MPPSTCTPTASAPFWIPADREAKKQAARARPEVGWIRGLQTPRVCFTHSDARVHNVDRLVETGARRLWGLHMEAPEHVVCKSLAVYHAITERGLVRWGAHLRTMARREALGHARDDRPCPACLQGVGTRHWVSTCPWWHLFRLAVHTQLHMRLDTLCARWKRRTVSPWGVIVLYGPDAFALSVGSPDDDDPHPGPGVRTLYLDPSGDCEPEDLQCLYDRGLVVGAAQRLLATIINVWDALDRKREMPIIPAAREVYYRDGDGHTSNLAVRVPEDLTRPPMSGGVARRWPDPGQGRAYCGPCASAGGYPPSCLRDSRGPRTGAGPNGSFGTRTDRCPGPWGVGPKRSAGLRWSSSTGRVAFRRGWSGSSPTGRHPATWDCTKREGPMTAVRCAGCVICCWPPYAWPVTSRGFHTNYWD